MKSHAGLRRERGAYGGGCVFGRSFCKFAKKQSEERLLHSLQNSEEGPEGGTTDFGSSRVEKRGAKKK